jgi:hypothetical protein
MVEKIEVMEGFGEFVNAVGKVIFVIFTAGLLITSIVLSERNKTLERELDECSHTLLILDRLK